MTEEFSFSRFLVIPDELLMMLLVRTEMIFCISGRSSQYWIPSFLFLLLCFHRCMNDSFCQWWRCLCVRVFFFFIGWEHGVKSMNWDKWKLGPAFNLTRSILSHLPLANFFCINHRYSLYFHLSSSTNTSRTHLRSFDSSRHQQSIATHDQIIFIQVVLFFFSSLSLAS